MVEGLTRDDQLYLLGLTAEALREIIICWLERTTGLNRQFLPPLHSGEVDVLVADIRAAALRLRLDQH